MADVQEVPVTRADDVAVKRDKDDLLEHLDELLERYLITLHEYQQQMQRLSKQLSSGYMSLAQANFHNSSAIRYGQDCYDERMQAIRKVRISEQDNQPTDCPNFSIYKPCSSNGTANSSGKDALNQDATKTGDSNPVSTATKSTGESEEESKSTPEKDHANPASEESKEKTKTVQKSTDPLKWFGILVPPSLRAAQSTFVDAVEGPIPQLATIAREMRMQEIEIGRVRKQIKKM
ncbi:hypothetical protein yc1106_10074 [Curvularia clavata]|uniref:Vacuolar ATPase assembly protein VMA22 n=1 Tax=Curvularia clavata TaxID=95742 RepID=A0A9Q8ZIH6_CURCL|nr:hypothetical protein yc1106_10074 [Curvularia clavata]